MFKKSNRKIKSAVLLICISCFILSCLIVYVFYPYININFILNISPFLSSGANNQPIFYGENIDMSQMLPTSQHYVVNSKGKDLIDIAADLGINLIRITNVQRSFDNNTDSIYTGDQWNLVLNKMQSKGIKALILIEMRTTNRDYYNPAIQPIYLDLVQKYIESGVFAHSNVYAVDIKNEPILTDANMSMLRAAHAIIKAKYPTLKQTIGWWATPKSLTDPYNPNNYNWSDFSAGQKIANIVDFYSVHMYGLGTDKFGINLDPNLKTKVFLSRVQNGLQTKKPILVEEFGEANGDAVSDQDTIGSPELQAKVYQGVYQALKEMQSSQIIGTVAFDFYSRNQLPDAWAIVKDRGDYLFPAAYILQAYALGKSISPSLQAATVVNSQSYLVKNADNQTIKNLRVSDRIGLELQLDKSNDYSVSLNVNGILQPISPLHYNPASRSYYAVYQAVSKGRTLLHIIPHANDVTDLMPVYTLKIDVQQA